jgi:hypothetical protein
MKFAYLTEIGDRYDFEEGTPGHRIGLGVWSGIETNLKKAITDLNNLVKNPVAAPAMPTGGNFVKDRIKFHEAQAKKFAPQAAIEEARRKVTFYREWLAREGAGADKDGNVQLNKVKDLKVYYDHDLAKQGMTRIRINSGRLIKDDGSNEPLNTSNMVTHFSGPGKAIYVMSQSGTLHVASHVVGHYHHSSLLAGADVGCAGELEATGGALQWLSNKSGHYRPKVAHILQVLHILQKNNVPMTFPLTVCSAAGIEDFGSVAEFMQELDLNDEPDYELMKLMAFSQHLTDPVLSRNGWRWRQDPLLEKPGVYVIATGLMVPHKQVRQWLKSQGLFAAPEVQTGQYR